MRVFQNVERQGGGATPGYPVLALIGFVGLCLLVGAVAGLLTAHSVGTWYLSLARPPGTPPNWVFAPVWTVLYVLIGIAGWMGWRRAGASWPIRLWGWQLLLNTALGLLVILPMLALIVLTIRAFERIDRRAALLMLPYLAWSCYATWLNLGFWWLNPHS